MNVIETEDLTIGKIIYESDETITLTFDDQKLTALARKLGINATCCWIKPNLEFDKWYKELNRSPVIKGNFIVTGTASQQPIITKFDLTNKDEPEFEFRTYHGNHLVSKIYHIKGNSAFNDSLQIFDIENEVDPLSPIFKKMSKNSTQELSESFKMYDEIKSNYNKNTRKDVRQGLHHAEKEITSYAKDYLDAFYSISTKIIYIILFHIHNKQIPLNKSTNSFNIELAEGVEKIPAIYEYTGYVDLSKSKSEPKERDPDAEKQEYERHIESWSVRGHWRKTKNGRTWVGPHVKGSGELEKRVYGKGNPSLLKLKAKQFNVLWNKRVKPLVRKPSVLKPNTRKRIREDIKIKHKESLMKYYFNKLKKLLWVK